MTLMMILMMFQLQKSKIIKINSSSQIKSKLQTSLKTKENPKHSVLKESNSIKLNLKISMESHKDHNRNKIQAKTKANLPSTSIKRTNLTSIDFISELIKVFGSWNETFLELMLIIEYFLGWFRFGYFIWCFRFFWLAYLTVNSSTFFELNFNIICIFDRIMSSLIGRYTSTISHQYWWYWSFSFGGFLSPNTFI